MSDPTLRPGDPLGGSDYPPGYTSPPPPGAIAGPPAGSSAPAGAGPHRLSGWGRRAVAVVVDWLIIAALTCAVLIPLGIGFFAADFELGFWALIGAAILTAVVFALVSVVYAPLMLTLTNGKTVGRMISGIRVIRADGRPMSFGVAVVREVLLKNLAVWVLNGITAGLPWATLLDNLWPLWDDENRALHDFPVNTRTVLD